MCNPRSKSGVAVACLKFVLLCLLAGAFCRRACAESPASKDRPAPPRVGDEARDFELRDLAGDKARLSKLVEKGPVVLVVLRGFPGYQCPLCSKQVAQFVEQAGRFRDANARVVLIYPGPAKELAARAAEFVDEKKLPENFQFLLDPDYALTVDYGLRWNAPRETAYPSTFVVDSRRKVRYAKVSKTHGDRAPVEDVLRALAELAPVRNQG